VVASAIAAGTKPELPVLGPWRGLVPTAGRSNAEDAMKSLALKVQRFLVSEDGPTAVEYAVMLALIVIVCLTAISSIGTQANTTFSNIANSISTANAS
jgi:pilus assembly protein Flp/PilA